MISRAPCDGRCGVCYHGVIREANRTGGCSTSSDAQRCILNAGHLRITARTLRSVMSLMGYRHGRGNIIGKMNDQWDVARIRRSCWSIIRPSSSS